MPIMSVNAYAKHRGVYHQAVREAIQRGTISKRADGKIDSEVADREWAANVHPVSSAASGGVASYSAFRAARAAQDAKMAQLKTQEKAGQLVSASEVARANEMRAAEERDALLGLPSRRASDVATKLGVTVKAAREVLTWLVRVHLEERSQSGEKAAAA